jgi:tellurite resistance protein TerC
MDLPLWAWFSFIGSILLMLALDLGVFHRKAQTVSVKGGE